MTSNLYGETYPETTWSNITWDIETNGFWPDVDKLWCLSIRDIETDRAELFSNYDPVFRSIDDALDVINNADLWTNHNILGYDVPIMEYLGYELEYPEVIVDTLLVSQVLYPNIQDHKFEHRVPKNLAWSHSLEAWGKRLGESKGEFHEWDKYTTKMGMYNLQDTNVNRLIYLHLKEYAEANGVPWEFNELPNPFAIEHWFKKFIMRQQFTGFYFDVASARALASELMKEKEQIDSKLQEVFPPVTETIHYVTPKRKEHKSKEVTTVFNPASRKQVGQRLMAAGWQPSKFTATGQPVINDETIADAALMVPEAAVLDRFFVVNKLLGSLINGDNAWLRLERDGKIHGQVRTLGAVTTRVTHNSPNMSQVPSVNKPYGPECRALFGPKPGWWLVGADLSGIELRCLAHYAHHWDKGEYAEHVLHGDVHTVHQQAFGLPPGKKYRSIGKTGTYCLIYGGGDWKLGWSLGERGAESKVSRAGKQYRARLMDSLPALSKLTNGVKRKRARGNQFGDHHIKGIAGHPLYCRSPHSALNTLLQSAGAQVAKVWYVLFHQRMEHLGYVYGEDYETHGFFHDEIQVSCQPRLAETVGECFLYTASLAGEVLGFRLPVEAEYSIGDNWKETH